MTQHAAGQLIAQRFRLERVLHEAARATVWAARDEQLGAAAAVKLARSPEATARFARQAEATAKVPSRHLVRVLDHGIDHGAPYLAMELLEGEDLRRRFEREGRLSLEAATELGSRVAIALAGVHEVRLVHGGVKPEHVFVARAGGEEVMKLLGCGAVATDGARATEGDDAAVRREAAYLSPEQLRGQPVDLRTDAWSLGVVLFEAITGRAPFEAATIPDLVLKICADALPTASRFAPGIPQTLDGFFRRALAREPAGRFQSASELATAFTAASTGQAPPLPAVTFVPVVVRSPQESGGGGTARTVSYIAMMLVLVLVVLFIFFGLDKTRKRIMDLFDDIGWRAPPPGNAVAAVYLGEIRTGSSA